MSEERRRRTIVIGHKNPDTDSICSAICYAALKSKITGKEYVPGRAGHVNEEAQYVLNYFNVEAPKLIESVKTQVKDIEIRATKGVNRNISLKKAWNLMQDAHVTTLPAVSESGVLEGLITVGDITKSYMNVLDSSILSKAHTQYKNILETLEGAMVVGDENDYFDQGKVLIAAANPDMMEYYISEHDLVILGNRYESQLCAIEMEADCIIVCEGAAVSMTIRKLAQEHGCTVMTTPYDAYTAARLINQSMPIGHFMKTEDLITFEDSDFIDDIKEVMASKRHRDFPILNKDGKYLGMISRRNLLGAKGKQIILVDHNEKNQAVDGLENADIQEIIDHHKLGTVETISPVFFRNQPVGCTATIVYQMYHENNVEIDKATAGMLCSAIISDTLLFRSPTCTPIDKMAATELAKIAEIDMDRYAADMFSAGSNLRGKSNEEIFYQDFKLFNSGKISYGVGQISSLNADELTELKDRLLPFLKKPHEEHGVDMIFFMLTNILTESTSLLCEGEGAEDLIRLAFHMENAGDDAEANVVELPGVVSRKKQLIPSIMIASEA
ncbi:MULTISPECIES: putative manganese-dependent inorganic diphosphatase [unclassified Clostridium]|uniref:putative manganese-dependent inorganic diphosphatase n=1 Tax=unclassified Clostridium TaxID=2614128 RepID=UPI000E51765D|nr:MULTISPECIES: putative manganese-dependent inorganic diphosphatase [unclassified Clostridium]RHP46036.1 putative manganese-dependent inorganic diphosphatase [Clostridium sp. AF32-12BH]RHV65687.1 putative manganese-dependent inorganic diphosphatase [Clostridium sp. OM02-18AC]